MLTVADDCDRTGRQLTGGELACPDCRGELRPWGHARSRWLPTRHGRRRIRPRRACCQACQRTHVLLPAVMLHRRADTLEVIGQALIASAAGEATGPSPSGLAARPPPCVAGCAAS